MVYSINIAQIIIELLHKLAIYIKIYILYHAHYILLCEALFYEDHEYIYFLNQHYH